MMIAFDVKAAEHTANTIQAAHPDKPRPPVTTLARSRNDLLVIPTAAGDQLVRHCQMCLHLLNRDVNMNKQTESGNCIR